MNRAVWSQAVRYTGNPDHKRNPGDFGLTPPASPRRHASLCDDANITTHGTALALLRTGIRQGLVSEQMRGRYPARIWAVRNDGVVFEARLEDEVRGDYHGYPIPSYEPLGLLLLQRVGRLSDV